MAHRLPPENYCLNAFFLEIAKEITPDDLHQMKSLLKGPGGIGRGILEDISSTMDFFDRLQTTGLVTVNDIVVLQALLWTIGKKDVYEKVVQFADQHGDILHVSSPNPEPANGYKYVKFHLKGKLVKGKVEDLRARVAAWLRVPTHFVVISGVQPTGSWYITLMFPEICREKLLKIAEVKRQWLIQQEIDSVELNGKVIDLTEDDSSNTDQTEEDDMSHKEIVRLAEVNKDLEEKIEILWSGLIKAKHHTEYDKLKRDRTSEHDVVRGEHDFSGVKQLARLERKAAVLLIPRVPHAPSRRSLAFSKFQEEKSDERSTTRESETSSSPTEGTNPKTLGF